MELAGQAVGQGWTAVAAIAAMPALMRAKAVGQGVQLSLLDELGDPLLGRLVGQGGVSIENAPRLSDRPTRVRSRRVRPLASRRALDAMPHAHGGSA